MLNFITQLRRGSSEDWQTLNIVPKQGELVLVEEAEREYKLKVGDGLNTVERLKFLDTKTTTDIAFALEKIAALQSAGELDTQDKLQNELAGLRAVDDQNYASAGEALQSVSDRVRTLETSGGGGLYYDNENSKLYLTAPDGTVLEHTAVTIVSGGNGSGP